MDFGLAVGSILVLVLRKGVAGGLDGDRAVGVDGHVDGAELILAKGFGAVPLQGNDPPAALHGGPVLLDGRILFICQPPWHSGSLELLPEKADAAEKQQSGRTQEPLEL
jgi:hypothetical protein